MGNGNPKFISEQRTGWRWRMWSTSGTQWEGGHRLQLQPFPCRLLFGFNVHHDDAYLLVQVRYVTFRIAILFIEMLFSDLRRVKWGYFNRVGPLFGSRWQRHGRACYSTLSHCLYDELDGTIRSRRWGLEATMINTPKLRERIPNEKLLFSQLNDSIPCNLLF